MGVIFTNRFGCSVGFLIAFLFLVNYVNCTEIFINGNRPVFVFHDDEIQQSKINSQKSVSSEESDMEIVRSRSALDFGSSEEADSSSGESGQVAENKLKNGLGRENPVGEQEGLEGSFESVEVSRPIIRSFLRKGHGELHAGRRAQPRLIWPFLQGGGWGARPPPRHFHGPPPPIHHLVRNQDVHGHHRGDHKRFDPEDDPEFEALKVELFRMKARTAKWSGILMYNTAEASAQIVTKAIDILASDY